MKKILVVGQTPPPYGGQAVMIDYLVRKKYPNVTIYHVRMNFSRGMKDLGKIQLYKIWHLLCIVIQIYYYRIIKKVDVLYYPPSGPNGAVFRDMMILFPTRWMFKKTIFHFHASGLSQHIGNHGIVFSYIFRCCFFYPEVAIRLSESCPDEGRAIKAFKTIIIPNGLPDEAEVRNIPLRRNEFNVLFVGLLEGGKGEGDLCKAAKILLERGVPIKVRIAGEFKTEEYKKDFFQFINDLGLSDVVTYMGIIRGAEKNNVFRCSDVFCFPSYFHSESFPLVLIEAMEYGLPIVSTRWRGIVDMVEDGKNGFLVDVKSPCSIADKLELLYNDIGLRDQMGARARTLFKERYDIQQHLFMIEKLFQNI